MELLGGTSREGANLCDIRVVWIKQGQAASYSQKNTGYFVDNLGFAKVEWKQGLQRPLVECTGTFLALLHYHGTSQGSEP